MGSPDLLVPVLAFWFSPLCPFGNGFRARSAVISPSAVADARLAGRSGGQDAGPPGTAKVQPALPERGIARVTRNTQVCCGPAAEHLSASPGPRVRERLDGPVTSRVRVFMESLVPASSWDAG